MKIGPYDIRRLFTVGFYFFFLKFFGDIEKFPLSTCLILLLSWRLRDRAYVIGIVGRRRIQSAIGEPSWHGSGIVFRVRVPQLSNFTESPVLPQHPEDPLSRSLDFPPYLPRANSSLKLSIDRSFVFAFNSRSSDENVTSVRANKYR